MLYPICPTKKTLKKRVLCLVQRMNRLKAYGGLCFDCKGRLPVTELEHMYGLFLVIVERVEKGI